MIESDANTMIAEARATSFGNKPRLEEMLATLALEIAMIEASQRALLMADMRRAPDASAIRRIVVIEEVFSFLDAVRWRPADVARKLNARARA